jgi:transmembrane protein EpsG
MIAVSIIWIAIAYLRDSLKFKFVLLIIIASLFHISSLVLLPFLFVGKIELSTNKLLLILGMAVIIAICNDLLISFLINIIPYSEFRLRSYINKEGFINPLNYIETLPILFITAYYRKELRKKIKNFPLYYNLLIAFTFILIAFYNIEDFKRLRDIFLISYIVIIPAIISLTKSKIDKLLIEGICCIYLLLLYVRAIIVFDSKTDICFLIPYKSFLF